MKKKILVVDDSPDFLMLVRLILEDEGYDVDTAENGLQALKQLEHKMFDLILLDGQMPEMDGYEFLSTLAQTKPHLLKKIPIVFTTAGDDARHPHVRGWIKKANGIEEIVGGVHRYLNEPTPAAP